MKIDCKLPLWFRISLFHPLLAALLGLAPFYPAQTAPATRFVPPKTRSDPLERGGLKTSRVDTGAGVKGV